MISVVTADNRARFETRLSAMHADRKRVFVDRYKWKVPVVDGRYEIDQFDTSDAVYLIACDERSGAHLGSTRLLPTTRPHLLSEIFPYMCARDVPVGDHIWEVSRMLTSPAVPDREQATQIRREIGIAMLEFALLFGITDYTLVTHSGYSPTILAAGWTVLPLGLPREIDGQTLEALNIKVTPTTLQVVRHNWGFDQPVLHLDLSPAWKAA